jgi:hypothetical protein
MLQKVDNLNQELEKKKAKADSLLQQQTDLVCYIVLFLTCTIEQTYTGFGAATIRTTNIGIS